MANIITDPNLFYRFSAPEIWADINPTLGEHLRLAQAVSESIVVYNKAYPPPPPGWGSVLGTVIFVGACCCVIGAVALSAAGASTAATAATTASANVATGVNAAAATAASATGTTVAATSTVSAGTASTFAATAAKTVAGASSVMKALGGENKDKASKMDIVADMLDGDVSVTDGITALYTGEMIKKNAKVQNTDELNELAEAQKKQYTDFLRRQAEAERAAPSGNINVSDLIIPASGLFLISRFI